MLSVSDMNLNISQRNCQRKWKGAEYRNGQYVEALHGYAVDTMQNACPVERPEIFHV